MVLKVIFLFVCTIKITLFTQFFTIYDEFFGLNTFFKFKNRTIVSSKKDNSNKRDILFISSGNMKQSNGSEYFVKKNVHVIYLRNDSQLKIISK